MFLRPQTQLQLWVRSALSWAIGVFLGLFLESIDSELLAVGLPVVALCLLLPLAFIGTWAAQDPEFPRWSRGRILLHWIVVPGATMSTIVVVFPFLPSVMLLASECVALTLLTGMWAVRNEVPKALMAPRW